MLRIYIAQHCFGFSYEGVEDAIYESKTIRGFANIDLTYESAPDAATWLEFRRLLEQQKLTQRIFNATNAHVASKSLTMRARLALPWYRDQ